MHPACQIPATSSTWGLLIAKGSHRFFLSQVSQVLRSVLYVVFFSVYKEGLGSELEKTDGKEGRVGVRWGKREKVDV